MLWQKGTSVKDRMPLMVMRNIKLGILDFFVVKKYNT